MSQEIQFPSFHHVLVEKKGRIVKITINRPEKLNAIHSALVDELHELMGVLEAKCSDCVLIFSGAGEKAFVAGADIGALRERKGPEALMAINARLMDRIARFPFPTIAQIRGYCFGAGMELALACDIRFCAEGSKFGQPEVGLNIIPAAGALHRLPAVVGKGMAREMVFSGLRVKCGRALQIGLVNRIFPAEELTEEVEVVARRIVEQGVEAVQLAKRVMNLDENHYLGEAATLAQSHLFTTQDKDRRMAEFLEKKKKRDEEKK